MEIKSWSSVDAYWSYYMLVNWGTLQLLTIFNLQLSHEHWILRNWSRNQSRNWTWTQQKTAEKEKLYLKYYKLEIEKLSSGKKTFRIIEMLDTTLRTISLKLQLNCTINDKKQKYIFYWSRVFCISSIRLLW